MSAWKNRNTWRWRIMVGGHIATGSARTREAALAAESGASLRDIQVWLGHTSPVTSTRYTHVELARLRAVADLVGARNLRAKHSAKGGAAGTYDARDTPGIGG